MTGVSVYTVATAVKYTQCRDFSTRGKGGILPPPENGFAPSELCLKWLDDKINFII